jgi:hypothetical protein
MSAPNLPEADGYRPGGGFQSLIGNGPSARDLIRSTLIVLAIMGLRELLGYYVEREVALRIGDLCGGAVIIGFSASVLLRPTHPESTPKAERGARLVFIAFLIAGSALATLSIQSLFFAE